jgi:hypothetical protein
LRYELFKILDIEYMKSKGNPDAGFNILGFLAEVYRDIEDFGLTPGSNFNTGWLCPIFKKGDTGLISNYRPITLLNTDYKLMTKAYSIRLMNVAPALIKPDQAGFMKGRKIEDQVKLAKFLLNYAEVAEEDGVLIGLDQEKAYDRINHDYLLRVLDHMRFPPKFSKTVKTLYTNGKTMAMVNGELSKPYVVTRGVRQGDPLSCLLFNLAIEPLACLLRESDIEGILIPGTSKHLIVSLFADDTTVYLKSTDSMKTLWNILNLWCAASTARFNEHRTILVPFGNPSYREKVITERRINELNAMG